MITPLRTWVSVMNDENKTFLTLKKSTTLLLKVIIMIGYSSFKKCFSSSSKILCNALLASSSLRGTHQGSSATRAAPEARVWPAECLFVSPWWPVQRTCDLFGVKRRLCPKTAGLFNLQQQVQDKFGWKLNGWMPNGRRLRTFYTHTAQNNHRILLVIDEQIS